MKITFNMMSLVPSYSLSLILMILKMSYRYSLMRRISLRILRISFYLELHLHRIRSPTLNVIRLTLLLFILAFSSFLNYSSSISWGIYSSDWISLLR